VWSYTSTVPHIFMTWHLVKHRNNFTTYLYWLDNEGLYGPVGAIALSFLKAKQLAALCCDLCSLYDIALLCYLLYVRILLVHSPSDQAEVILFTSRSYLFSAVICRPMTT
jgi:hypothetical protein